MVAVLSGVAGAVRQMEMRYSEAERARNIFERYIRCIPDVKAWVRYAKFEMQSGEVPRARRVYERAVEELQGEASMVRPCPPSGQLPHHIPRCIAPATATAMAIARSICTLGGSWALFKAARGSAIVP